MDSAPQRDDNRIRAEHIELLDQHGRPVDVAPKRRATPGAPVSWLILGANFGVFFFYNFSLGRPPLELAFHPTELGMFPGLISHMFAHGGGLHLLGNMLIVLFLGTMLEPLYGAWRYTFIYLVAGVVAALSETLVHPGAALIGASGATSALLAMFARHFPNVKLYIWGILPLPAWLLAVLWLGFNIYGQYYITAMPVAFMAHVVGLVAGLILSYLLLPPARARRRFRRIYRRV